MSAHQHNVVQSTSPEHFLDGASDLTPQDLHSAIVKCVEMSADAEQAYQRLAQSFSRFGAAARERSDSDARLLEAVRVLPGGIVIVGGDGCIEYFNPAAVELLGELSVGELWRDSIGSKLAPRWDDGHDLSLKNGRRVHVATQALSSGAGQVLLLSDSTAQRQFNEELSQAQRMAQVGQMASGLAHQIRTPLSTVMLYASQLTGRSVSADKRARSAERMLAQLAHLERLVEDTLLFARCGTLERELIDLKDLLGDLVAEFKVSSGNDYRIDLDLPEQALLTQANRDTLRSAFQNIIDNAIDAADGSGCLRIQARQLGEDRILLIFTDDGPGLSKEAAANIFEPFVTHSRQGTGLGLAVVKAILHAHGGTISTDTAYAEGARFLVRLPLTSNTQSKLEQHTHE